MSYDGLWPRFLLLALLLLAPSLDGRGLSAQETLRPSDEHDEHRGSIPVDYETGMPLIPPSFPASFRAEIEQRVVRAEGKTDLRVTRDDDDVDDDVDNDAVNDGPEPVLATVYYERRMQAERMDVHAPRQITYLFLYSKAVVYVVDETGCVTSPITVPMSQPRLSQSATFRGKRMVRAVGGDRKDDGEAFEVEHWESRVLVYDTREELWTQRDLSSGSHARFSTPVRDVFHRVDRGADITVVTDYLQWSTGRMDPALFRPPSSSAQCKPGTSAETLVALEHRNTLHFNPLHAPRLDDVGESPHLNGHPAEQRRTNERARATHPAGEDSPAVEGSPSRRGAGRSPADAAWSTRGEYRAMSPAESARARAASKAARSGSGDGLDPERLRAERDRGWRRAGVVNGIPEGKDDGTGPSHVYGRRARDDRGEF